MTLDQTLATVVHAYRAGYCTKDQALQNFILLGKQARTSPEICAIRKAAHSIGIYNVHTL